MQNPASRQHRKRYVPEAIEPLDTSGPPEGKAPARPVVTMGDDHGRRVLRRLYRLISYRSLRAASLCVTQGRDGDAWWRWIRRPKFVLPHGRRWAAILWHLHMRRDHGVIFLNIKGYDAAARSFVLTRRAQRVQIPNCEMGGVLKGGGHNFRLWRWLGGGSHTFGDDSGELAYLARAWSEGLPVDLYKPTRMEWLRLAEMAIWHVYGYDLTGIYSVDWVVRDVEWKLGREPRTRREGRRPLPSQLPINPCELLDLPDMPL